MNLSNFQQVKANFYFKYNQALQIKDIYSLYSLINITDSYISYLECITNAYQKQKQQQLRHSSPNRKQNQQALVSQLNQLDSSRNNFYRKYNQSKQIKDIYALHGLINSPSNYIACLEGLSLQYSKQKEGKREYRQCFSPTKIASNKMTQVREEQKEDDEEIKQKLHKLQKMQKIFHSKISRLQQERRRRRQLKEKKKRRKEQIKNQIINVEQEPFVPPSPTKKFNVLCKQSIIVQPIYQNDDLEDSYYNDFQEVKIVDNITVNAEQNRKRLKQLLQKPKLNSHRTPTNRLQAQITLKYTQSLSKDKGDSNRINNKDNIATQNTINDASSPLTTAKKEIQQLAHSGNSKQNEPNSKQIQYSVQVQDTQQSPIKQIAIKIHELQIQKSQFQENFQNQQKSQPNRESSQNTQNLYNKQSAIQIHLQSSQHNSALKQQTPPSYNQNNPQFQKTDSLYLSNSKIQSQAEDLAQKQLADIDNRKAQHKQSLLKKPNEVTKFFISKTINQQIQTYPIKQSQIKLSSLPTSLEITLQKPRKINFKQALKLNKNSKASSPQIKRYIASGQSPSRKQSTNALFTNFFKQN